MQVESERETFARPSAADGYFIILSEDELTALRGRICARLQSDLALLEALIPPPGPEGILGALAADPHCVRVQRFGLGERR